MKLWKVLHIQYRGVAVTVGVINGIGLAMQVCCLVFRFGNPLLHIICAVLNGLVCLLMILRAKALS